MPQISASITNTSKTFRIRIACPFFHHESSAKANSIMSARQGLPGNYNGSFAVFPGSTAVFHCEFGQKRCHSVRAHLIADNQLGSDSPSGPAAGQGPTPTPRGKAARPASAPCVMAG